jgi:hypothetical protein
MGADLLERQLEHVVEHERQPLRRRQGVEHDQQGQADGVGQQRLLVGLEGSHRADDGIGDVDAEGLLAPGVARAQHVQADAGDDRGQPAAEVLDPARVRPADTQPGVLDGVVRLGERAQHPVGHRPQMGTVLLETVGQPLVAVHRSHPLAAACQQG